MSENTKPAWIFITVSESIFEIYIKGTKNERIE